jgi:hypothetical protein
MDGRLVVGRDDRRAPAAQELALDERIADLRGCRAQAGEGLLSGAVVAGAVQRLGDQPAVLQAAEQDALTGPASAKRPTAARTRSSARRRASEPSSARRRARVRSSASVGSASRAAATAWWAASRSSTPPSSACSTRERRSLAGATVIARAALRAGRRR